MKVNKFTLNYEKTKTEDGTT